MKLVLVGINIGVKFVSNWYKNWHQIGLKRVLTWPKELLLEAGTYLICIGVGLVSDSASVGDWRSDSNHERKQASGLDMQVSGRAALPRTRQCVRAKFRTGPAFL